MRPADYLADLEHRVGGVGHAARLLGVSRSGTYATWKANPERIPRQSLYSIQAHVALSDSALKALLEARQ